MPCLPITLYLSTLKLTSIPGLKCSLKDMMPESGTDLREDPSSWPSILETTSHSQAHTIQKHKVFQTCGLKVLKDRSPPPERRLRVLLYISYHTPTGAHPSSRRPPGFRATSCSRYLATPLHWRMKKRLIVLLPFTAAVSRSLPPREERTSFIIFIFFFFACLPVHAFWCSQRAVHACPTRLNQINMLRSWPRYRCRFSRRGGWGDGRSPSSRSPASRSGCGGVGCRR